MRKAEAVAKLKAFRARHYIISDERYSLDSYTAGRIIEEYEDLVTDLIFDLGGNPFAD